MLKKKKKKADVVVVEPTLAEVYKEVRALKKMIMELKGTQTIQVQTESNKPKEKVKTLDSAQTYTFANHVSEIFKEDPKGVIFSEDGTSSSSPESSASHAADLM